LQAATALRLDVLAGLVQVQSDPRAAAEPVGSVVEADYPGVKTGPPHLAQ